MKTDEYRALVEAGPPVVMVAKEDMLRLLKEHRYCQIWGAIYWWMLMILCAFTLLETAAKWGLLGGSQ
jgi:hypothetical protein